MTAPRTLPRARRRRFVDLTMRGLCALMVVLALVPLASLLALVISRGARALSLRFLTALPAPVGESGGIGNAIVGSLFIVGMAALIAIPAGLGAGLFLSERGDGRFGQTVRFCAEALASVPSIVVGFVVYAVVVLPTRFSAFAGALALALLMIPTLARAAEELLRLVPRSLREASLALGVPAWRTSLSVVLRTALPGLVNACILVVARAAGETAPLLLTSFNNQNWNLRPDQPTASLPVLIFNYALSPYEEWHEQAWGAALVLLTLVGGLSLASRALLRRSVPA